LNMMAKGKRRGDSSANPTLGTTVYDMGENGLPNRVCCKMIHEQQNE
jgi:hypothetical protein